MKKKGGKQKRDILPKLRPDSFDDVVRNAQLAADRCGKSTVDLINEKLSQSGGIVVYIGGHFADVKGVSNA